MRRVRLLLLILLGVTFAASQTALAQSKEHVKIGLAAVVSGGSATACAPARRWILSSGILTAPKRSLLHSPGPSRPPIGAPPFMAFLFSRSHFTMSSTPR